MQRVKIISDSTCDLSDELKEKYNVEILPLHVVLGEKSYDDGITITADEILEWAERTKESPKTTAISPEEAVKCFSRNLEEYDEIVCFSISSSMSNTNMSMHMAAQELDAEDRIHVIDSANLSTGIGLLVLEAAEMAMNGADGKTIVDHVERQIPLVRASFVVDTLMYLYRGGRCSGLSAVAGEALHLHPRIAVTNGEMAAGKKYRGKMDRVIMEYAKDMESDLMAAQTKRVFVTHSKCDPALEKMAMDYLRSLNHFEEVIATDAGGVVTCHCGPGTLGILFIANDSPAK